MDVLILTKINGFDLEGTLNGNPINLKKSKFYKGALEVGVEYEPIINKQGDINWLNSVKPIKDEKLKFDDVVASKMPTDNRQLLIMAQSCQHDAVQIISSGIDLKDYSGLEELSLDIIKLRDILLKDLINKYMK